MSAQFSEIRDHFLAALEQDGLEAQLQYAAEHCAGDPKLHRELEEMLRAHHHSEGFLASKAAATQALESVAERPGVQIGPYKLMEQIGEGGMGLVFVAEQHQPVRRKVALKVIKPGMDTRDCLARFEAERQALALMDHPNIARVLDAGATASGRPYFVMELVKGVPITQHCDDNRLSPRERLELFTHVCHAVQHAHQKGIIHRDIKPTNVLVSSHDGHPVVKVIDFGVAKAIGQQLTERTIYTAMSQMVGTPLYMSPEQAGMSGLDIDTRTDIYSLGVLLYELLTGTTPFDKERLRRAAYDEMRRIIREEEPQKPSTRISSTDGAPSIAACRHTEPSKLAKLVRGDLDWIVMKALEKDRSRRYETANGFAADVLHYLADEPVSACPPSTAYRFRKFARRNKAALATAGVVAAVLFLGTAISTWQAIRATSAERAALVDFGRARDAVDRMLTRVAEERLVDVPGMEPIRKELLEDAIQFYEQLLEERNSDPGIRFETARAHLKLGWIQGRFSETDKQQAAYGRAHDLLESLVKEYPDDLQYRSALAKALHLESHAPAFSSLRWKEAEQLLHRAIELQESVVLARPDSAQDTYDLANMLHLLGNALVTGKQPEEAEKVWRRALAISQPITVKEPNHPAHLRLQIRALTTISNVRRKEAPAEAEALLNQASILVARFLALPEKERAAVIDISSFAIAGVDLALGDLYKDQGRREEADAAYRRAVGILDKYATDFPGMPFYRFQLAGALATQGTFLLSNRQPAEAETVLRRAWQMGEALLLDASTQQKAHEEWQFYGLDALVRALAEQGRHEEALQICSRAAELLQKLPAEPAREPNGPAKLALAYKSLADSLTDPNHRSEAEQACREAIHLFGKLAAEFPDQPIHQYRLAQCYRRLADLLSASERLEEAEQAYRDGLDVGLKLIEHVPADINYRYFAAWTCQQFGKLLQQTKRPEEAEQRHRQAIDLFQTVAADRPAAPEYRANIGQAYNQLAGLLWDSGKLQESEDAVRQSLATFEKLMAQFPAQAAHRQALANLYQWQLTRVLTALGRPEEVKAARQRALSLWQQLSADFPDESLYWHKAGVLQHTLAQPTDAIASLTKALELRPDFWESWYYRGVALASLGQWDEAIAAQTRSLELKPDHSWSWYNRGLAYSRLKQWDKAVADYAKAIALGITEPNACISMAGAHAQLGEPEQAIADLRQAIAKGFRNVRQLKERSDLAGLRSREDFKELLEDFEAKRQ